MTKKKRRRRGPARAESGEAAGVRSAAPGTTTTRRRPPGPLRAVPSEGRGTRPSGGQSREAATPAVVHPPAPQSIARGIAVVGGSPAILLVCFLGVLGLWIAFMSYATLIAEVPPGRMSLFESLPPLHTLLVDLQLLASNRTISAVGALAFGIGVVLYRAAFTSLWISLMVQRLAPEDPPGSTERPGLTGVLARAGRSLLPVLVIELGFLTLAVVSLFVGAFLGAGIGQLAIMVGLIGGAYFLVFAPAIAVVERISPRSAVRLAVRTARIPGPRHLIFTVGYIAISLLVSQFAPGSVDSPATPSISVWAYALFVNALHLSAQAALVYRWLSVRGAILAS